MDKLQYILKEIKSVKNYNIHVKNAKDIKVKFYNNSINKLNNIKKETILKHSFTTEVLKLSELLKKKVIINKFIKDANIKIEKHKFAPELNKLIYYYKDIKEIKHINTPNVIDITKNISIQKKLENHNYINLLTYLNNKSINYLKQLDLEIKINNDGLPDII